MVNEDRSTSPNALYLQAIVTSDSVIDDLKDDPDLVFKLHSSLAAGNPDVLAYAAQLGDENVVREFLKDAPNEVWTVCTQYFAVIVHYLICRSIGYSIARLLFIMLHKLVVLLW